MNNEFIIRIKRVTYIESQDVKAGLSKVHLCPPRPVDNQIIGELRFRNEDERNKVLRAILSAIE